MQGIRFWVVAFSFLYPFFSQAQKIVLTFKIEGEIDPRSTRHVKLALEQAQKVHADAVLAEINTFGGLVDDSDKIRTLLLESKVPVFAFINKNAASAGALISPTGSAGSSTVVAVSSTESLVSAEGAAVSSTGAVGLSTDPVFSSAGAVVSSAGAVVSPAGAAVSTAFISVM